MYHSLDRKFIKTSKTTRKASFKDEVLSKKHIAGRFKDEMTSTMMINQCRDGFDGRDGPDGRGRDRNAG